MSSKWNNIKHKKDFFFPFFVQSNISGWVVLVLCFRGYLDGQLDDVSRIDMKLLGSKVIGNIMLGFFFFFFPYKSSLI